MSHSMRTVLCVVAAISALLVGRSLLVPGASAQQKAAPIEISVDEIGKNLILIGRLKKPLGTLMTIRGKWSYPDGRVKDYSLRFTVTHVDGQELPEPVEFNVAQLKVVTKAGSNAIPSYESHKQLVGVEWTLRAYETGSLYVVSEEAYRNEPTPSALPYWFDRFTPEINGVLQP